MMTKQEIKQREAALLEMTGEFCRQNLNDPFNELVKVDGFIVPIDTLPDDLQQRVREA